MKNKRILYTQLSEDWGTTMEDILRNAGYIVDIFDDIDLARRLPPYDLYLFHDSFVDPNDGLAFALQLQKEGHKVMVIGIEHKDITTTSDSPLDRDDLLEKIKNLLN